MYRHLHTHNYRYLELATIQESNPSFSKVLWPSPDFHAALMARAFVRVSPWQRRDPGAWLGCGSVDVMPNAIDVGVRRGMTSASEPWCHGRGR